MARHRSEAPWFQDGSDDTFRIRMLDLSNTSLGPRDRWPPSLRTAVGILAAAPLPMFLFWGHELRWFYNDAGRAFAPAGEQIGERGSEARIPAWEQAEPPLRQCFEEATPSTAIVGSSRWRMSPVVGEANACAGVIVFLSPNDAESADAARLLAESEARLRLGLEAGRMVTWEFDLNSGVLTRSANSAAIFGGGDRPQDYTSRMPPEDIATDKLHLERALAGSDGLYQSEFRYNHPDGRQLHLQNWGKIMRDSRGNPARVHGVCMDVTDRKRAEHALKYLNETLEQEVRKRTDALVAAQEALQQSQRMEALGHITGGVAHDFNNLLGAMVGSFDLICRKADDPARVRQLAKAGLKVADRGEKLTGQLLTFSRGQRIELRPVDLADILHGMRDLLERTLGPHITLALDLTANIPAARSDATQLEMAILNLAINARDAMPGGGTVTIATKLAVLAGDSALPDGDYVQLTVRDTGTGMSPNVVALAFDPFFTTKEVGKGTGLGLSQVYGIARQAGGAARIESAPGAGTAVVMLLPCAEPDDDTGHRTPSHSRPLEAPAPQVLLVDDDLDLREVMAASIEELGYRVLEAPDGLTALTMLEAAAPDLLIVDFAMPGMTGAELAKAARARWPGLPIVFASGYADNDAIDDAIGPGTLVLHKPFRIEELQSAIVSALSGAL